MDWALGVILITPDVWKISQHSPLTMAQTISASPGLYIPAVCLLSTGYCANMSALFDNHPGKGAMMIRFSVLFVLSIGLANAGEITTVESWEHWRQLEIEGGSSEAEADERVDEMLANLGAMDRNAGADRIGVAAPSFDFEGWINSQPLSLEDLRGQVVLVRWWTETCPFCASSAPALRAINEQFGPKGVTVIGVYHPKADRDSPYNFERVERAVAARKLDFPIAIDWDWRNGVLADWWLTGPKRPATSVTFLLDKNGVIQYVHPGMEYHAVNDSSSGLLGGDEAHQQCAADMLGIEAQIERLLAEN